MLWLTFHSQGDCVRIQLTLTVTAAGEELGSCPARRQGPIEVAGFARTARPESQVNISLVPPTLHYLF